MSTERTDDKEHFDTPGRAERRPAGEGKHAPAPQRPPAPAGSPSRDAAPAALSADVPGLSEVRGSRKTPCGAGVTQAACALSGGADGCRHAGPAPGPRGTADTGPGHRWGVLGSVALSSFPGPPI